MDFQNTVALVWISFEKEVNVFQTQKRFKKSNKIMVLEYAVFKIYQPTNLEDGEEERKVLGASNLFLRGNTLCFQN